MKSKINLFHISLVCMLLVLSSCRIKYSFTGASLAPDMRTVNVQYFTNQAPIFQPTVSNVFTEALKDKLISQSNLELVKDNSDLDFQGEITGYNTSPVAIQGNETAALNRLTISVHVKFTNNKNSKLNFDKTFQEYADFESSKTLSSVESELITQIVDKLTEDIFNASLSNW